MSKQAQWFFDFISPFSYLQLRHVLAWRERLQVTPMPILFGAVLQQIGQLGPAEIPGKREFTYRSVQWQAARENITLRFPDAHPFNPMSAPRLAIAADSSWPAIAAIFDHVWRDGRAADAAGLADVGLHLGIADVARAIDSPAVKAQLRANTEAALAAGVYGVPTLKCGDEMFWGNDATPMIEDWLAHPELFSSAEYRRIADLPVGIRRQR
ncbi:MAG: 2-hydroxychromene-2-carboxylate isomerase [Rudaea sp.]